MHSCTAFIFSGTYLASFCALADHPGMPDNFNIVRSRVAISALKGLWWATRRHTLREACEWIDRQVRPQRSLRIDYTITPAETGTRRVALVRTDRSVPEELGEFSTLEDANEFLRRMRELDAGPTHGGNP